eukprot:4772308-Amphidinium_carterae.1
MHLWTDGSFDAAACKAGYGAVLFAEGLTRFASSSCRAVSSTWSELVGLWQGLQLLPNRASNKRVRIFSDSKAGLDSLTGFRNTMPVWMQAELKRVFDLGYELEFVHCPAHVGVSANEVADEWARLGLAGHACIGGVPTSYILRLVKHEALRSWISDSTSHE